jgi:hypothetical protein
MLQTLINDSDECLPFQVLADSGTFGSSGTLGKGRSSRRVRGVMGDFVDLMDAEERVRKREGTNDAAESR